ncbi:MAG: hypothetical protein IJS40_03805 [Synergistaceae bacterium]|nr:hypothetical protein [Synergistaceae bacterium]
MKILKFQFENHFGSLGARIPNLPLTNSNRHAHNFIGYRLSAIGYRLSAIGYRLSAIA